MSCYISRHLKMSTDDAEALTRHGLAKEGFGDLSEIDVRGTLKQKLDIGFPPYRILGARNSPFALKTLQSEPRVGMRLLCNLILRELSETVTDTSAIGQVASAQAVDDPALVQIAGDIRAPHASPRYLAGTRLRDRVEY